MRSLASGTRRDAHLSPALLLQKFAYYPIQERRVLGFGAGRGLMPLHRGDLDETRAANVRGGIPSRLRGIEQVERRRKDHCLRADGCQRRGSITVETRRHADIVRLVSPRLVQVVVCLEAIPDRTKKTN